MTETSLHAALKSYYAQAKENQEILVDGYQIDAVREDLLIEIQTSSFGSLKKKLADLLPNHAILLVHPVALEKWIVQMPAMGRKPLYRRKSPRRGRVEDLFRELVYITDLLNHSNLRIDVVLVREEEIRRADGLGSWRRKGVSIIDHRLLEVVSTHHLLEKQDFRAFLPPTLPVEFTVQDIANKLSVRRSLAQKMVYCLRKMHILRVSGKRGRAMLYDFNSNAYNP
jgi:hypothetical protein